MDQERKKQLERQITESETLRAEAEGQIEKIRTRINAVEVLLEKIRKEKENIGERKKRVQSVERGLETAKIKLGALYSLSFSCATVVNNEDY